MEFSRRDLIKVVGAAAVTGAITPAVVHRASAHTEIDRTITIIMGEMFFQQEGREAGEAIEVPANQVVRLILINDGAVLHDAHFGLDPDILGRKYNTNLAHPFEMLEIPPGNEAWITFEFTDDHIGAWEIGCFQLGHYEAGMKAPFIITN